MKVKSESEVAQSCLTLHDPMDCSLPGSFIHGIFQARVLEWVAIAFSGQSSRSYTKTRCLERRAPGSVLGSDSWHEYTGLRVTSVVKEVKQEEY